MPAKPSSAAARSVATGNWQCFVPFGRVRRHLLGGERARHLLKRALLLAQLEIHVRRLLQRPGSSAG